MTTASREPLHPAARELPPREGGLASYPPVERWGDWEEYDPIAWPQKVKRRYELITTNSTPVDPKGLPITVLSIAKLLGQAIIRINSNESVTGLFKIKGF